MVWCDWEVIRLSNQSMPHSSSTSYIMIITNSILWKTYWNLLKEHGTVKNLFSVLSMSHNSDSLAKRVDRGEQKLSAINPRSGYAWILDRSTACIYSVQVYAFRCIYSEINNQWFRFEQSELCKFNLVSVLFLFLLHYLEMRRCLPLNVSIFHLPQYDLLIEPLSLHNSHRELPIIPFQSKFAINKSINERATPCILFRSIPFCALHALSCTVPCYLHFFSLSLLFPSF